MAQSKNNIVTHGLSGKVGDILVFSQRNGKTIVSKAPKKRKGEDSEKQKQQQAKFQQAVLYGKAVLADDNQKALYETTGKKAYNELLPTCSMHLKSKVSMSQTTKATQETRLLFELQTILRSFL
ncbi:hypothetical protein ACILE2_04660 [Capnocytophaga canimorsus]|uniref:hypothetical protein n=1 Tax=Capnocytophaga canimorsus TaxID=28188 RepID=UPI0037D20511